MKATFLLFYRLLFDVNGMFRKLWWGAVALTFATFWVCIGSTFTLCGDVGDLYDFSMCAKLLFMQMQNAIGKRLTELVGKCSSPEALHDVRATYKYWCALNVATDLVGKSPPPLPKKKGNKNHLTKSQ